MSDIYNDGGVTVTASMVQIDGKTYQLSGITSVQVQEVCPGAPMGIGLGCVGGPLALAGLLLFFLGITSIESSGSSPAMILAAVCALFGVPMVAFAGSILKQRSFVLSMVTAGTERQVLAARTRERLDEIAAAIQTAFAAGRGV